MLRMLRSETVKSLYNKNRDTAFWIVFLTAMVLKYFYFGFQYFPVMDDHNMYGLFSLMSPGEMFSISSFHTTRPAAVLLDLFVITPFWGNLQWILLLMIILHFTSCFLIFRCFEKLELAYGKLAVLLFGLFPLATDASYWIAASSRLVAGLFFAVLSFYMLILYIEKREKKTPHYGWYLFMFALFNLVSLGFYEQIIVFSFAGACFILMLSYKRLGNKLMMGIPVINLALIAGYYKYFENAGNMASRGQLVDEKIGEHTQKVFEEIYDLMTMTSARMFKRGIENGLNILWENSSYFFLILLLIVSAMLGFFFSKEARQMSVKRSLLSLVIGILLIWIPCAPFFLLKVIWISNRNVFLSFIGLGMMAEAVISLFEWLRLKLRLKWKFQWLKGVLGGLFVFGMLLGNIAETYDYKRVSEIDTEIMESVARLADKTNENGVTQVLAFNTKRLYITPNLEHFVNCTAADWTFTGAAQSILRRRTGVSFVPVADKKSFWFDLEVHGNANFIGFEDEMQIIKLSLEEHGSDEYALLDDKGETFGLIKPNKSKQYYFEKAK